MFHYSLLSSFFDRVEHEDGNKYYLYKEVWTDYASDLLSAVFMYAAIVLAVALIGIGLFVKLKKRENFAAFLKTATTVSLTFAITVIGTMLSLGFAKIYEKGYTENADMLLELVPPLVTGGVTVAGIIASYIAAFCSKKAFKATVITSVCLIAASLTATVICLVVYYSRAIAGDGYYDSDVYGRLNQAALYGSAAGMVVLSVAAAFVIDRKNNRGFDSKCIALAGICVALSFALSYIKLFSMPQGGSVTLASMLPVMLFAYIYGTKKGLFVGLIYGLLQAMQDPHIIHPAQFLLDYPVAFAMVGFAGAFSNITKLDKSPQIKFALGAILSGSLRFLAHVLSGVFAFGAYAMDAGNDNFWLYSTAYNAYIFIDVVIVIAAGAFIFSSKNFNRRLALYSAVKQNPRTE